ncbi:phage portal protein [Clostridium perfringens]|nr:phage portal protein [Clostridium perfringens]
MLEKLFESRNIPNPENLMDFRWDRAGGESQSTSVSKDDAIKISTIFACLSIRANHLAKLPIGVFKSNIDGKERVENDLSYLLKVRPNPNQSAFKFKQTISVILDLFGNCYVWMESKRGKLVALWILPPDTKLENVKGKNWIITKLNEKDYKLKYEEVLHFSDISTTGVEGISKIDVAKELINNIKGRDKLVSSYYKNGNIVKGILSTAQTLDREAKELIKRAWANSAGNLDLGGIAVVDSGFEFKGNTSNFTDYQFVDLAKLTKEDIAMIYNIPVHMLNQLDKATFSNIENLNIQFFQTTIQPLVTMIENEMDYKLFTELERKQGYFIKFNTNAMLRADSVSRVNYYKEMLNNGVMSINDVRELEDLNRIENGDKHYRSLNYVPIDIADNYQLSKAGASEGGDANG